MIWLFTWNYDYEEGCQAFRSRRAALASIAKSFEVRDPRGKDTKEWWRSVGDAYNQGRWKGAGLYRLDPETLKITKDEASI